jgi:uncharacterized iron-regulated membrane protein
MSWKRTLFLFHRWTGIVLCLFFALWFVSGIFMMYVQFPELTKTERLVASPALDFSAAHHDPLSAIDKLQSQDFTTRGTPTRLEPVDVLDASELQSPRSVRMTMVLDRPAYVVHADNGAQPRVVFADDGSVLREVTPAMGHNAVAAFVERSGWHAPVDRIVYDGIVQTDQWSVSGGLNEHRPLLRYRLRDEADTVLYVSSRTGEVVRDTQRLERVLNYFGAVTHWLYPTFVRKYPLLWEWIVDILSGVGVVLAITGLWIGWMRWNRRAKPGKPQIPYHGLMRWHYFTGIVFGLVTVTWVFSGLMSMNPLNLNPPRRADDDQQLLYTGKALTVADFALPAGGFGSNAVEADLMHYAGQAFYRVTDRDATSRLIAANEQAVALPSVEAMLQLAPRLIPTARLIDTQILTRYDNYYYSRHPERGARSLPVIRVRFDDESHTWFHLDPMTGQILERSTRTNRVYRWIYNGLHSFDIWWLWQRRPLWDIVVIAFSVGGTLLSIIGVVIGWRRLRYKSERRAAAQARAGHATELTGAVTTRRSVSS